METEQKDSEETKTGGAEQPLAQAPQSVGVLLRAERERLRLSREQISEMTRMRAAIVKAIENEAWGSLPPPVFVRGFLKTYAKVLSLNPETVIELYGKSAPQESPGQVPRPGSSGKRRRGAWLIGLALVVLASLYGAWLFFPSSQAPQVPRETERREKEPPSQPAPAEKEVTPPPVAASPAQVRAAEGPPKTEPAPMQAAVQEALPTPKAAESPVRDQAGEDGWLSLTGIVKERTWLRIRIDGKEEKEYLLQPGSRPQWRGKENFYMLVGNAGGIEFDLNGKRVANLGKPGQVIRLTLPKEVGQRERAN